MKVNSTEVAKRAGVSRSTVSRVINNNSNVVESTRKKVLKVIEELNYTPNTNAQSLAGKKSSVIGLFIFEDDYMINMGSSCLEYYMNFVSSLGEEVFRIKHQLLIDIIHNQESMVRLKSLFENGNISYGIFIGAELNNPFIDEYIKGENKIALIDYSTDPSLISENVCLINTADFDAAYAITNELIENGNKRILHITGNMTKLTAVQRKNGHLQAIKESNISLDPLLIVEGNYREKSGYDAVIKCFSENIIFDSIFAGNDLMARGAQQALIEQVAHSIPIWGYDNLQGSLPIGIMSADPCLEISAVRALDSLTGKSKYKQEVQYSEVRLIKDMEDYLNSINKHLYR